MALQILAGVPPLELELIKIARIERDRIAVRRATMTMELAEVRKIMHGKNVLNRWQNLWTTSLKGRWTARWFPDIRRRMEREWCQMDHQTSHLMSGHGNFNAQLHRFNLKSVAACRCGDPNGTAEHLLMECPLANQEREKLKLAVQVAGADWPC